MLLDIVILPPANLRNKIGKAVIQATAGHPCRYVIDNKKLIPHMSLFHIRTSSQRFPELGRKVKIVISKYCPQIVRNTGLRAYEGIWGTILLTNNKALQKLNKHIVQECYKLRTGQMPWNSKEKPKGPALKKRLKYGTQHNIGKTFVPHFTVFAAPDETSAQKILKKLESFKFSFRGDTIAICRVNSNHQVTKILKTFRLK